MTASTTRAGRFQFTSTTERWWWSDEMFRIHGMEPAEVVPTTELFLSHVHPEERTRVAEALAVSADPEARTCEYRLVDLAGTEHHVTLVVAHQAPDGAVGTSSGFVVDATRQRDLLVAEQVNEQLTAALESHAAIDQAKGVLMLTYGVDSETAFAMLRTSSQQHNVRLRTLAARVVHAVDGGLDPRARDAVDRAVSAVLSDAAPPHGAGGPTPLELRLETREDVPVLRVCGGVDLSNRGELAAAVAVLVHRGRGSGRVVVDLVGVRRVSPAAADVLTSAIRRAADQGIFMTIVGGQPGGPRRSPAAHGRVAARR
ncbi:ANTAR domain-containing protein [uncultured Cellulomonas sp.]|uniref:ANTAR domain-containing protein n=1 Tax=uncultured Cellulomonas sp. TaxID=189682 RepID=UPI0028F1086F|nr:ANTAR domain-containing protein [uncultured Cellulomonas sp.]